MEILHHSHESKAFRWLDRKRIVRFSNVFPAKARTPFSAAGPLRSSVVHSLGLRFFSSPLGFFFFLIFFPPWKTLRRADPLVMEEPVTFFIQRSKAGTVNRIRLENFMCHSNLEIELGHRLNFITGQNGSKPSLSLSIYIYIYISVSQFLLPLTLHRFVKRIFKWIYG